MAVNIEKELLDPDRFDRIIETRAIKDAVTMRDLIMNNALERFGARRMMT